MAASFECLLRPGTRRRRTLVRGPFCSGFADLRASLARRADASAAHVTRLLGATEAPFELTAKWR
jgi:hypothetical protein